MITHVIWDLGDTLNNRPPTGMDLKPLDAYSEIRLRPHAAQVLGQVASMGLQQAVLSNTAVSDSDAAKRMLEHLQIGNYFDFVYATQSELNHGRPEKPDPAAFHVVLDALSILPDQAVMVGNTWESDILGANRCGIHAIFLLNPIVSLRRDVTTPLRCPPWVIPVWDLAEVPSALEVLKGRVRKG